MPASKSIPLAVDPEATLIVSGPGFVLWIADVALPIHVAVAALALVVIDAPL